jgi:hypothetical protein
MADSEYYRTEARRCRRLAGDARTIETARRWFDLADEYDQLAVSLERGGVPPSQGVPMQQQPMQQQQQQKIEDDK